MPGRIGYVLVRIDIPVDESGRVVVGGAAGMFSAEAIDALLAQAKASGSPIDGRDGVLNQLTKAVLERALSAEMTEHVGYETGDPARNGTGNSRNCFGRKTVSTVNGSYSRTCSGGSGVWLERCGDPGAVAVEESVEGVVSGDAPAGCCGEVGLDDGEVGESLQGAPGAAG